jgi:hypothetical protein
MAKEQESRTRRNARDLKRQTKKAAASRLFVEPKSLLTIDLDVDARPRVCVPMVKPVCAVVQARSTLHAFTFADPSVTNFITHAVRLGG